MIIEDKNKMPQISQALQELENYDVQIGVFDDEEMILIASVHEYGSLNVPERSFIRSALDENHQRIDREKERLLGDVLDLRISAYRYYERLGQLMVNIIQERMDQVRTPPLQPETRENRTGSNPLVDTGELQSSIEYRVVRSHA